MRGDVHVLKAPRGARGHEQRGDRFAVVVQSDRVPLSTLLVAPTSTRSLLTSFRAEVDIGGTTTLVMVEQAVAVAPARLGPVVGHLTRAEMDEVDRALRTVLELG